MKKNVKRMALSRETLHRLTAGVMSATPIQDPMPVPGPVKDTQYFSCSLVCPDTQYFSCSMVC